MQPALTATKAIFDMNRGAQTCFNILVFCNAHRNLAIFLRQIAASSAGIECDLLINCAFIRKVKMWAQK